MSKKQVSLFEVKPSDSFWIKEIKSIEEIADFDLEFGKRYLLELINLPNGEQKFMHFMRRARLAIDDFKELEALDLSKEEDEIFERLNISITVDKFLRSKGWIHYGAASLLEAFVLLIQTALLLYELKHNRLDSLEKAIVTVDVAALSLGVPTETFLFLLLKNTVKHEIDDSKYEELQRAVLQLVNKFPAVFDENSQAAKIVKQKELQELQENMISI